MPAKMIPGPRKPPRRVQGPPPPGEYHRVVQLFQELYERWNGQGNFQDVVVTLRAHLPRGATNLKMTAEPFTATYALGAEQLWLRATPFGVRYNDPGSPFIARTH